MTTDSKEKYPPEVYINRELSWLDFARRVLELAEDPNVPLLERVKFAGIMGMIYDEFAMKRIGGLRSQIELGNRHTSADGLTPEEELVAARAELNRQWQILRQLVTSDLRPALARVGIPLLDYEQLDERQRASAREYYHESVEPIITPLSVDVSHPFPFISNLSLNLAVLRGQPGTSQWRFIRVKVPPNRPRWVPVDGGAYVPLEQVMAHNLHGIHAHPSDWRIHFFRVTRGAKDDPWDRLLHADETAVLGPGSLIGMVSAELTARRFAGVVHAQVSDSMPEAVRAWLADQLHTELEDIVDTGGLLGTADLLGYQPEGFTELRDPPHVPVTHPRLRGLNPYDPEAIFAEIRRGDILLHHPYHSFDTSVLHFLQSAARDPQVLAIKLTIYRTSKGSPIIQTLTDAAQRGKQVAVLVEITARFDEAPNIAWGERLEQAGAHVVYGMERLKTHVKLGMVVREEEGQLRRYVHFATGNYHTGTARLYEDLGVLSCAPELGPAVAAVFNEITAAVPGQDYGPLLVGPHNLRPRFVELIRREVEHAGNGRPCGIRAKMNQLQDKKIIRELYDASQAGVPISLNVRGLCCLRAGVEGLSENVRVFSTLGRFLEHGRIYRFENGGQPEFYVGSADWMKRNLDSRMETIVPIAAKPLKTELEHIMAVYEADNCTAWDMQPDGKYVRRRPAPGEARRPAQETFIREAEDQVEGDG